MAFYDVKWEYAAIEADTPEEAAQIAHERLLEQRHRNGGCLVFVVNDPDLNSDKPFPSLSPLTYEQDTWEVMA